MAESKIRYTFALGEMAEWSIAAVLKTVELRGSGGSNPSLSAIKPVSYTHLDVYKRQEYLDIVGALPKGNQSLDDSDPNKFVAQMGAEAIYTLLQQVDLDSMSYADVYKRQQLYDRMEEGRCRDQA